MGVRGLGHVHPPAPRPFPEVRSPGRTGPPGPRPPRHRRSAEAGPPGPFRAFPGSTASGGRGTSTGHTRSRAGCRPRPGGGVPPAVARRRSVVPSVERGEWGRGQNDDAAVHGEAHGRTNLGWVDRRREAKRPRRRGVAVLALRKARGSIAVVHRSHHLGPYEGACGRAARRMGCGGEVHRDRVSRGREDMERREAGGAARAPHIA